MAESPSHRFGQVVGNLLEEILKPELLAFCEGRGLYLDRHGTRLNVRGGKKVSWQDRHGNSHDLDFVIEKGGSEEVQGRPVAFIEAAWRRYTKHSRAKAQEIQGAILPIAEKYELESPFLGAVLAGLFTAPSLDQLRSLNFNVVHLPYDSIVEAFAKVGIDARFDENTPDRDFRRCVNLIEALAERDRSIVKSAILHAGEGQFQEFYRKLRRKLDQVPDRIIVVPLFGTASTFETVAQATAFIEATNQDRVVGAFRKYEVSVSFSNTDEVRGTFTDRCDAVDFLRYVTA